MEKYIGTYHKSSPFIHNLLKKQICSFEILWSNYPPPWLEIFSQICCSADLLKSVCSIPPFLRGEIFFTNLPLCRFTEICMQNPPFWRFFSNLPLFRFTEICMQKPTTTTHTHTHSVEIISQIWHSADLLKSACRNSPPV